MPYQLSRQKVYQAIPRGVIAYEKLRSEWISANPEHSELELLQACISFARACNLALRASVLSAQLSKLNGELNHGR